MLRRMRGPGEEVSLDAFQGSKRDVAINRLRDGISTLLASFANANVALTWENSVAIHRNVLLDRWRVAL